MDMYGFYTGQILDAHTWLGAHYSEVGTIFRTFAPQAAGISLLYNEDMISMNKSYDGNFFEVYVPNVKPGEAYEYRIWHSDGTYTDHCDPFGFAMELRPEHRSIVVDLSAYSFSDAEWMKNRSAMLDKPVNIYEMHMGSWKKPGEAQMAWYSYEELADILIPYLKENHYNYVEFLPLCEHPSDESWGYQNTGYFAPTSRYGTPEQLKILIDKLHQNGIGAILDFVPVHFAIDSYGLSKFDGSALFEYPHQDVGVSEWGSCNFMHSRGEVRSFLQSSANYWLKEFHFDGLRMDAISRIIYWQGDEARGINGNAVEFIKVMNRGLKQQNPGCMLIAEDSTNFPNITRSTEEGGLGFDYKWDMGWMHDTLSFFQTGPEYRTENYHKLTFSMMYYYNERYLLPLSHDEVVHGKATILQKMYGDYDGKFPQGRTLYLYMMVHPGKKLNFMGSEFGQLREWDEKRQQDWLLFAYPIHEAFYRYMRELNHLYLTHPALSQNDFDSYGFDWLDCHQEARCIYAIKRQCPSETLIAIFNLSDETQTDYCVSVNNTTAAKPLLYTDWETYGGKTSKNTSICSFRDGQLHCTLAPYSGMLLSVNN